MYMVSCRSSWAMFGAPGSSAGLGTLAAWPPQKSSRTAAATETPPQLISRQTKKASDASFPSASATVVEQQSEKAPFPQTLSSEIFAEMLGSPPFNPDLQAVVPVPGSSAHHTSQVMGKPPQQPVSEQFSNPFEDEFLGSPVHTTGAVHTPKFDALQSNRSAVKPAFMPPRFLNGVPLTPSVTGQTSSSHQRAGQTEYWSPPMPAVPPLQQGNASTSNAQRHAVSRMVSTARSPTAKVLALTGHCSLGDAMNCLFQAWATQCPDGQLRINPLSFAAITTLHGPPAVLSHVESHRYFNLPLMMSLAVYGPASDEDGDEEEDKRKVMQLAREGPIKAVADKFGTRTSPMRKLVDDFFGVTPVLSSVTRFSRTNMSARSPATYIRSSAMKAALHLYRTQGPGCFEAMKQAVFAHVLAVKPWLASIEGGLTLDQWQRNYSICPRCTVMRIERSLGDFFVEGAQNLSLGVIRTRPSKEFGCLGTHVRCCDHYQWKWCPGFDVTGNEKCRDAPSRGDACPRYFARSTIWKHQVKPGEEKTRGSKRDRDDDDY